MYQQPLPSSFCCSIYLFIIQDPYPFQFYTNQEFNYGDFKQKMICLGRSAKNKNLKKNIDKIKGMYFSLRRKQEKYSELIQSNFYIWENWEWTCFFISFWKIFDI